MPKKARTHDIFLNDGTTNRGFMLAETSKGVKMWRVNWATALAMQYATGQVEYANLAAEEEILRAQDTWIGGLGEETWRNNKRYLESYGVDARWADKLILGPLEVACNTTSDQALTDLGIESWADANTAKLWPKTTTGGTLTLTRDSTTKHAGTYAACLTATGAAASGYLEQSVLQPASFQGKSLQVKAWVYRENAADTVRLDIVDVGGTTSASAASSAEWEEVTATRTIDAAATYIKIRLYFTSGTAGRRGWYDDLTFTPTAVTLTIGTPIKFIEAFDKLFLLSTTALWEWDNTNTNWIIRQTGTYHDAALLGLYLYLMQGGSGGDNDDYDYTDDGQYFVEFTGAEGEFDFCAVVGTTLYAFELPNEMRTNDNPIIGGDAWSGITYIGDASSDITGVVAYANGLYIGKEDGLFENVGGTIYDRLPEFDNQRDASNFKNLKVWQSKAYLPTAIGELYEYDAGDVTNVSLSKYGPKVKTLASQIVDMVGTPNWFYCLVPSPSGSNPSYILAGRWETIAETIPETDWRWHSIAQIALLDTPKCVHISTLHSSQRRLWYAGTHSSVGKAGYFVLPPIEAALEDQASSYPFASSGTFITGYLDFGFPSLNKPMKQVIMLSEGLGSQEDVLVEYQLDNDTNWATLDTFTTSPMDSKAFAAGVDGYRIRFRLTLTTDDNAGTPVVRALIVSARLPLRRLYDFTIKVADNVLTRHNTLDGTPAETLAAHLATCSGKTAGITLTDLDGSTHTVVILSMIDEFAKEEAHREPERRFHIRAAKIA